MRLKHVLGWLMAAATLAALPPPARAQDAGKTTQAAIALFRAACVRFTGNEAGLRAWIAAQGYAPLQGPAANAFAVVKPAQVFLAATANGPFILSSSDNGACAVLAEHGSMEDYEATLLAALKQDRLMVAPIKTQTLPGGLARQQIYGAVGGARMWSLSVTAKSYAEALDQLPMVILLATVAR